MMSDQYDLVIIGSGPGGYEAAIRAAQYGLKTAIVEKGVLGGTCLNRGCIPTKALLHACEVLNDIRKADSLGIVVEEPHVDLKKMYAYKDKVVRRLRNGVKGLLKGQGVDVFQGHGRLQDPRTVLVENEGKTESIQTRNVILATGSRPSVPPVPGLEDTGFWTSRTILEDNPDLPGRIIIIGGGVIGVETATILNDLGVEVTIVEMMDQLLPRMDTEIAENLLGVLEKSGIAVKLGVKVKEVRRSGSNKACVLETSDGEVVLEADELMVATGRSAVSDEAGIVESGVKMDRGRVLVDKNMRTNLDGVYAIGDVTGTWWLAHAASAEGLAAVDHITGKANHTNRDVMPACVYTTPEISSVGLTEQELKASGRKYKVGKFPLAGNGKSLIMGDTDGFVKILADEDTGEILGTHIIGPRATDLIAELATAMSGELSFEEVGAAIHPHPTVSESVMEAIHDIEGLSIHKL
jgi:dihydrolipoamide dehydrogenase